ncbi:MAG: hypothetical protein U0793_10480 [Gemmataceae bacterium]
MRRIAKWGWPVLVLGGMFWLMGGAFEAKEPEKTTSDRTLKENELYYSLKDVINRGAKLFNEGSDHAGCYRVFEGALLTVRPYLSKKLQEEVTAGLVKAAKMPSFTDKAFELRRVLDLIRAECQPIWARLGGEEKVLKLVEDFMTAVKNDPKIDFDRGGKVKVDPEKLKADLVTLISELTGGPYRYSGKSMKEAHKGMKITEDEFRGAVGHMRDTLKKHGAQPKDIDVIVSAMEATHKEIVGKGSEPEKEKKDKVAVKDKIVDIKDKVIDKKEKVVEIKDKIADKVVDKKDKVIEVKDKGIGVKDKGSDKKVIDVKDKLIDKKEKGVVPAPVGKGDVAGRIVFEGKPLPGGNIVFHSAEGDKKFSSAINADGTYSLKDVPAGKYSLTVSAGKGGSLPAVYADPMTSALVFRVSPGMQVLDLVLMKRK